MPTAGSDQSMVPDVAGEVGRDHITGLVSHLQYFSLYPKLREVIERFLVGKYVNRYARSLLDCSVENRYQEAKCISSNQLGSIFCV